MSKRRHQRVEGQNLVANLSDGVDSFSGTVNNISRLGMLLNDIPQRLKSQGKILSIIVSAKGKNFKMQVEPKWVDENKSEKKMGLAILDPPLDWTLFAMIYEPADEDIPGCGYTFTWFLKVLSNDLTRYYHGNFKIRKVVREHLGHCLELSFSGTMFFGYDTLGIF